MILEMNQWLHDRMSALPSEELGLDSVLSDLTSKWPIQELIKTIANSNRMLDDISKRSYRHPNGFDRIELISSAHPEFGLRLHIWWGEDECRRERVHGHPWNFASDILVGVLHVEQFIEVERDGTRVEFCNYQRPDGSAEYTLTPCGTTRIRLIVKSALAAGSHYFADHQLIHRVWTDVAMPTATLVLHGRGIAYPSRVFLDSAKEKRALEAHQRSPFDVGALKSSLNCLDALFRN